MIIFIHIVVAKILTIVLPLLISVAYFTLAERKILGAMQRRKGPNVVGIFGLLQPLSDGFKLLVKETIIPSNSASLLFIFSPILTFFISLLGWAVIPFSAHAIFATCNLGILYLFAVSALGVYGIILSGWSSNSKYAFLGALRSTAQMVSYEVSMGFIIISIILVVGSFNLEYIVAYQKTIWFIIPFYPLWIMFFVSSLAETNRHPFDLPEAEAELVSGYNVEYSAMVFALFSLGEYSNMLLMSTINIILFFGGWLPPLNCTTSSTGFWFSLKICIFVILFVWMRGALPRYRYDQLMAIGWKIFLPVSLVCVIITTILLCIFSTLPY